ncbi:hypothetical protein CSPX01_02233 [Colletotrichum filicis]|nr:hypothetical protein CSPX01_02233 [Colletotrichum filicis]
MLDVFPDLYLHSHYLRINVSKAKLCHSKLNFTLTTSNAMASRYPMPNTYAKTTKQKTDSSSSSSSSLSTAVKSIFSAPASYPSTPYSTSKYPLPTAYTPRDGTNNKRFVGDQQMGITSRVSVESRDTIDDIKKEQLRGLGR